MAGVLRCSSLAVIHRVALVLGPNLEGLFLTVSVQSFGHLFWPRPCGAAFCKRIPLLIKLQPCNRQKNLLALGPSGPKLGTEASVAVSQVKNVLWKRGGLDDTPNLDGALVFDESADGVQKGGRELGDIVRN